MKNISRSFILLLVLAALFAPGCKQKLSQTQEAAESATHKSVILSRQQLKEAGISFGTINQQLLSADINARGKLFPKPESCAAVSTLVGGRVERVLKTSGQQVVQGEPVVVMADFQIIEMQEEYVSAAARHEVLRSEFQRQKSLHEGNVNARRQLEEAQAAFTGSKAKVKSLEARLHLLGLDTTAILSGQIADQVVLKAPVQGTVTTVNISQGMVVQPGMQLMEIINNQHLGVELMVFERDIQQVVPGQRIDLTIPGHAQQTVEAVVTHVGATVEPGRGTIRVFASLPSSTDAVYSGMFVAATIHTSEQMVDALPEEAVYTAGDGSHLIYYTSSDTTSDQVEFSEMVVKTGFREDGFVQVEPLQPLAKGSFVVVKGTWFVRAALLGSSEE